MEDLAYSVVFTIFDKKKELIEAQLKLKKDLLSEKGKEILQKCIPKLTGYKYLERENPELSNIDESKQLRLVEGDSDYKITLVNFGKVKLDFNAIKNIGEIVAMELENFLEYNIYTYIEMNKMFINEHPRYILEVQKRNEETCEFEHKGYIDKIFNTIDNACKYYKLYNPDMREINEELYSDWDAETGLRYLIRTYNHESLTISPFKDIIEKKDKIKQSKEATEIVLPETTPSKKEIKRSQSVKYIKLGLKM